MVDIAYEAAFGIDSKKRAHLFYFPVAGNNHQVFVYLVRCVDIAKPVIIDIYLALVHQPPQLVVFASHTRQV